MNEKEDHKKAIVCVDDERMVLESLKAQLMRHFADFDIEIAESGQEAISLMDELIEDGYTIPMIISDQIMPSMTGDELLISIHEKYPQTLKVLLTGLASANAVGNAINKGGLYRYIAKPWEENDLILTVKEGICSYYQAQTLEEQNAELKSVITELEMKNAELEQFTYSVSHDLKAPLITIKGFLSYLEEDIIEQDVEKVKEDISHIKMGADKMNSLLDDLLELSRVGRVNSERVECAFNELINEATENLRTSIKNNGVRLEVQEGLGKVTCERGRVVELLQNLMENAIKFNGDRPAPKIDIGKRSSNGNPVYFVRDNGIGVNPKFHDKIFGLFERLETNTEGTGIGLAIAKKIVQSQGGEIWIESEGENKGSTFCFTLSG